MPSKTVNGLLKGLRVLTLVSESGGLSAAQISQQSGFPRPTVYRLLDSLIEGGYIVRVSGDLLYRPTALTGSVFSARRQTDLSTDIAIPILERLTEELGWPCDFVVYEDGNLVIKATTHSTSPLSLERIRVGRSIRMAVTASGHAYLAFTSVAARTQIVGRLLDEIEDSQEARRFRVELEANLELTRRRGWGLRIRGPQPKTSAIAVPVLYSQGMAGCICVNWIASAITPEEAQTQCVASMQGAARLLSSQLDEIGTRTSC